MNPTIPSIQESTAQHILSLIAAGQALGQPDFTTENGIPFGMLISGSGTSFVSLEKFRETPAITRAKVIVNDAASFIAYVNRFKSGLSPAIFAHITETGATFTAIMDYHTASGQERARRGDHRVVYTCEPTPEWKRWVGSDRKPFGQTEFAQFLEDNAPDIVTPSSATMMEVALSLEARTAGEFSSATRLQNGSLSFRYSEAVEAKAGLNGNVEIPTQFEIGVAPFVGFPAFKVEARLRYRLNSGKLTFWYELVRTHKIVEAAAKDVVAKINQEIEIPPFIGSLTSMGLAD